MCFAVIFQKLTHKPSMIFNPFGATSPGHYFSTIHGDLIMDYFNKASKETAKFYRSEYISHHKTVNKWVVIFHDHSKFSMIQRKRLQLHTSSKRNKNRSGKRYTRTMYIESHNYKGSQRRLLEDNSVICIRTGQ